MTLAREAASAARPVRRRWSVTHVLAAGYAGLTLVALGSWWLVGDRWWNQLIHLTTFWWMLPAVALAPLLWAARWRGVAALLTIPAVTWLWSYGSAFLPSAEAAGPSDLRVMSFNTYVHAPDLTHVLALVERHDPDVLLLQEVFPDREQQLRVELGDRYPEQVVVQSPRVGGVAVLSRFPIVERTPVLDATAASRSTEVVTLDVDGTPVQAVSVHLISPCPTCGTSVIERLDLEGEARPAEIAAVLDALDPRLPAIVGGDLNSTERSGAYRRLVSVGFDDPQRAAGWGMGFTWPNQGQLPPFVRIDWVMTRALDPVAALVDDGGASDHRAVIVDLALPGGGG